MCAEKKVIIFYLNTIRGGGAARVMIELAYRFSMANYRSVLVTSFAEENEYAVPDSVERISIEEKQLDQPQLVRNISRIRKLRMICKKEKPIALISFMKEPNFRAICATFGLRTIKNIVSVRNDPNREYAGIQGKIVGKFLLPLADGCVFQTESAKAWFPIKLQKKSAVIYNTVKEEFYQVKRHPVHGRVVTCGRLVKQKRQDVMIDAFLRTLTADKCMELVIYGDGEEKDSLQKKIDGAGMSKKIRLAGEINDVKQALTEADIFVLSSDFEGMPNALMEAMAVGIPCIATDCPCGGPRELFGEECADWLVSCGDVTLLSEKMKQLVLSDTAREAVGKKMKQNAVRFKAEIVFEQWRNYIEEICR